MTRRDRCYLIGRRAAKLNDEQAAKAWKFLASRLDKLGDKDVPKFTDLLVAIRMATLAGRWFSKDVPPEQLSKIIADTTTNELFHAEQGGPTEVATLFYNVRAPDGKEWTVDITEIGAGMLSTLTDFELKVCAHEAGIVLRNALEMPPSPLPKSK